MSVSPLSSSVLTRKVGSSSARRCEGEAHLVLVGLRLGLDLHLDDRLGEGHRLQDHRVIGIGQGVAGVGLLEADRGGDVAGVDLLDLLAVVRVHLEDAPDPLLAALRRVEDVGPGLERPGVDPEEGELADVRVGRDLEGEGAERLAVVDGAQDLGVRRRVLADHRRHVERRREVGDDGVEHRLDALVLEGGAGQDGHDPVLQGAQPEPADELVLGQLGALEVLVHQLVVHLGDGLDELLAVLLRLGEEVGRDRGDVDLGAQVVAVEDRLHPDQVDDPGEGVLGPDRDLDRAPRWPRGDPRSSRRSARSRRRCGRAC